MGEMAIYPENTFEDKAKMYAVLTFLNLFRVPATILNFVRWAHPLSLKMGTAAARVNEARVFIFTWPSRLHQLVDDKVGHHQLYPCKLLGLTIEFVLQLIIIISEYTDDRQSCTFFIRMLFYVGTKVLVVIILAREYIALQGSRDHLHTDTLKKWEALHGD